MVRAPRFMLGFPPQSLISCICGYGDYPRDTWILTFTFCRCLAPNYECVATSHARRVGLHSEQTCNNVRSWSRDIALLRI